MIECYCFFHNHLHMRNQGGNKNGTALVRPQANRQKKTQQHQNKTKEEKK